MTRDVPGLDALLYTQAQASAVISEDACIAMIEALDASINALAFSPATMIAQWGGCVLGGVTLVFLWLAFEAWRPRQ